MAVLRPLIIPSVGLPQTAVASQRIPRTQRGQTMANQGFYANQQQQSDVAMQQAQAQAQSGPQFEQAPVTGDYLAQELQKFRERTARPNLEPGARVRSADMSQAQPSNFNSYYDRLGLINQMGDDMLASEQAKAANRRAQQLASIMAQSAPSGNSQTLKTGGSGGQNFGGGIPSNPQANFRFAQEIAPNYGWSGQELNAWYTLGMKESGWRNTAQNPTSTAYGIGQFLNSTWKGYGIAKTSDPALQVEAMARYIKARYGSPSRALAFHISHNWY